jgi:hypothetical protein
VARGESQNDQTPTISFNFNFGHELLILNPGAKSQQFGGTPRFQIKIKESKTPGDEHCLDPPGAELLAWL